MPRGVNLAEWARAWGVYRQTACRWFGEGMLPVPAVRVSRRTVLVSSDTPAELAAAACGWYARVSSHDQKPVLGRRVARVTAWAAAAGGQVVRVEAEAGSGVNGSRAKVRRLLADPAVTTVVAGHRGRPGRMITELAGSAVSAHGRRLVVPGDGEVGDDLVRDMAGVLTWFCARLRGRRSARNRALTAVGCAERDLGPEAVVGAGRQDVGHG